MKPCLLVLLPIQCSEQYSRLTTFPPTRVRILDSDRPANAAQETARSVVNKTLGRFSSGAIRKLITVQSIWLNQTHNTGMNQFGSIRVGSVIFEKSLFRFGSVRQVVFSTSMRFGLRFLKASWFGSVPHPVPAGSEIKRFGSVRPVWFGRFGSVSSPFLRVAWHALDSAEKNRPGLLRLGTSLGSKHKAPELCAGVGTQGKKQARGEIDYLLTPVSCLV